MSMYSYCMFMYLYRAGWHSSATLTEVYPCFFLSCKANASAKLAKTGHGPHSFKTFCVVLYIFFVFFSVMFVCKCVLYYCHRVATQLQFNKFFISFQELNSVQFISNKIIHCLCTINSNGYTWLGDCFECVQLAQLPILIWSSSSVSPKTTSTIGSPPGTRRVQHPKRIYNL
jgi:magnesium-transporting ATPase (P-type)